MAVFKIENQDNTHHIFPAGKVSLIWAHIFTIFLTFICMVWAYIICVFTVEVYMYLNDKSIEVVNT